MCKLSNSSLKGSIQLQTIVIHKKNLEFYKQPKEILLKVIDILEKSNKAAKI